MERVKDSFVEVLEWVVPLDGKTILEVGCGTGERAAQLARKCNLVIGIDPNVHLVGAALQRGIHNAVFVPRTAQDTGMDPRSVDITLFSLSLHHVPHKEMARAIDEAVRVTRPDGYIIFLEPGTKGSFYDAELAFDACDGDETQAKLAAQLVMRNHPRLAPAPVSKFEDEAVFRFAGTADFLESMKPKKNLHGIEMFLRKHHYTLHARRCINIYRIRH